MGRSSSSSEHVKGDTTIHRAQLYIVIRFVISTNKNSSHDRLSVNLGINQQVFSFLMNRYNVVSAVVILHPLAFGLISPSSDLEKVEQRTLPNAIIILTEGTRNYYSKRATK